MVPSIYTCLQHITIAMVKHIRVATPMYVSTGELSLPLVLDDLQNKVMVYNFMCSGGR